jgi:hypothetical protein
MADVNMFYNIMQPFLYFSKTFFSPYDNIIQTTFTTAINNVQYNGMAL